MSIAFMKSWRPLFSWFPYVPYWLTITSFNPYVNPHTDSNNATFYHVDVNADEDNEDDDEDKDGANIKFLLYPDAIFV